MYFAFVTVGSTWKINTQITPRCLVLAHRTVFLKSWKIENSPENSAKYSYKNDFPTFLFKNVMFLLI